jgi:hypothetical protein
MRNADDYSSRGAPGVSMRAWLYLGAAVLGLSLMGLEDPNAQERIVDEVIVDQTQATNGTRAAASSPAVNNAVVVGQEQSTIKLDITRINLR